MSEPPRSVEALRVRCSKIQRSGAPAQRYGDRLWAAPASTASTESETWTGHGVLTHNLVHLAAMTYDPSHGGPGAPTPAVTGTQVPTTKRATADSRPKGSGAKYLGPDRTGRMLEVITVEDIHDGEVAIHEMKLRKAYERYLPREDRP